ncbi:MAG: hypothetical protein HY042_12055 [Spirochaetia bacterium]|nr:hypothetical protein [Spirochaetia bacterium]
MTTRKLIMFATIGLLVLPPNLRADQDVQCNDLILRLPAGWRTLSSPNINGVPFDAEYFDELGNPRILVRLAEYASTADVTSDAFQQTMLDRAEREKVAVTSKSITTFAGHTAFSIDGKASQPPFSRAIYAFVNERGLFVVFFAKDFDKSDHVTDQIIQSAHFAPKSTIPSWPLLRANYLRLRRIIGFDPLLPVTGALSVLLLGIFKRRAAKKKRENEQRILQRAQLDSEISDSNPR